jgi:hypothetical protein
MLTRAFVSAFLFAFIAAISTVAHTQPAPTSNYTSFEATTAKPVQLGYHASAHKNCTPAPLPVVRVIEAPNSGMLTVRRGELKTEQVAGCPGLKIPAQVVFYQARKIGIATIRRIEGQEGPVMGYVSTLMSIQSAFEQAGIIFLDDDAGGGIGVRLGKKPQRG